MCKGFLAEKQDMDLHFAGLTGLCFGACQVSEHVELANVMHMPTAMTALSLSRFAHACLQGYLEAPGWISIAIDFMHDLDDSKGCTCEALDHKCQQRLINMSAH